MSCERKVTHLLLWGQGSVGQTDLTEARHGDKKLVPWMQEGASNTEALCRDTHLSRARSVGWSPLTSVQWDEISGYILPCVLPHS